MSEFEIAASQSEHLRQTVIDRAKRRARDGIRTVLRRQPPERLDEYESYLLENEMNNLEAWDTVEDIRLIKRERLAETNDKGETEPMDGAD